MGHKRRKKTSSMNHFLWQLHLAIFSDTVLLTLIKQTVHIPKTLSTNRRYLFTNLHSHIFMFLKTKEPVRMYSK